MTTSGYVNPELLADTQWLAERLIRRDLRVVDMGSWEGYVRAHIPGAVHPGAEDRAPPPEGQRRPSGAGHARGQRARGRAGPHLV